MPTLLELPVPEMGPRLNSGELYFRVHAPFFPAMPDQSSKGSWRAVGRRPPLHRFGFRSAALPSIALPCGRPAGRTIWHDARCGSACFLREFVGRFLIAATREPRPRLLAWPCRWCAARLNEVGPRAQGWCLHRDTGPTCQPSFPPSRRLAGCPPISAIWWKLPRQAEGVQPFAQGGGVLRPGRLGVAVEEVRRALVRLNLRWGPRPRRVVEGAQGRAPPAGPSQPAGTLPNAAQAMSW